MILKWYQGRPVQRMSGTADGNILLTFFNTRPGERKERLVVSQADWKNYGSEEYCEGSVQDLRRLAKVAKR